MDALPALAIFLIDDNQALCETLRGFLRENGWRIEIYASAEAFLDSCAPQVQSHSGDPCGSG